MYKVVIIDDNKPTADSLAKLPLWKEYNCGVERVCYDSMTGKEAILIIRPDIILSDIQMPGLNGLDIIDMLRSQFPDTKVIFMSAYDNFKYAQRAIRLGAHDYLLKPFSQDALRKSLKEAVEWLHGRRSEPDGGDKPDDGDANRSLVQPIFQYINQRVDQHITAEEVASAFFMSVSRLDKLLKANCGKGFRELRIELRMAMARELLTDVRYRVDEIGIKVGYTSYVSFYRAFSREYGVSPTEYRERMQSHQTPQ